MARGAVLVKGEIGPDEILVQIPESDGDPLKVPPKATSTIDRVSVYTQLLDGDDLSWRRNVAKGMMKNIDPANFDTTKKYVLAAWPSGYTLWDHQSGPRERSRHDLYLFGGSSKFRSANEFIPHAIWLYGRRRGDCGCRYCVQAKTQTEISQKHGLSIHGGNKAIVSRPTVRVRRGLNPTPGVSPGQRLNGERNADLRAMAKGRRRYRIGELVWTTVSPPIRSPVKGVQIDFWPGIVKEYTLSSQATPHAPGEHYEVRQMFWYKIKLLGVLHAHISPEDEVLPYMAYVVAPELMSLLQDLRPSSQLSPDLAELYTFFPVTQRSYFPAPDAVAPGGKAPALELPRPDPHHTPSFHAAGLSFTFALQISAYLASFWGLSDSYRFTADPGPTPPPPPLANGMAAAVPQAPANGTGSGSFGAGPGALAAAISGAFANNAAVTSPAKTAPAAPVKAMPIKDKETRYQGLWWGAERIWQDELVRLKGTRRHYAPEGDDYMFVPSPLAESRALFLRINSIFVPEADQVCKVAGAIFELAEEDWEDPEMTRLRKQPKQPVQINADKMRAQLSMPPPPAELSQKRQEPSIRTAITESPFGLPTPPTGFKFRPVHGPDHEVVMDVSNIAGRYYHGLLENLPQRLSIDSLDPSVRAIFDESNTSPTQPKQEPGTGDPPPPVRITALGGLFPGYMHAMDCLEWKRGRKEMAEDADRFSREALYLYWYPPPEGDGTQPVAEDAMVVDPDPQPGATDVFGPTASNSASSSRHTPYQQQEPLFYPSPDQSSPSRPEQGSLSMQQEIDSPIEHLHPRTAASQGQALFFPAPDDDDELMVYD